MAWLEDAFDGWGSSLLLGVGVSLAAPVIFPVARAVVRPIAKGLIGGTMALMAFGRDAVSEVSQEHRATPAPVRLHQQATRSANGASPNGKARPGTPQKNKQTVRSRRDRSRKPTSATARAA